MDVNIIKDKLFICIIDLSIQLAIKLQSGNEVAISLANFWSWLNVIAVYPKTVESIKLNRSEVEAILATE